MRFTVRPYACAKTPSDRFAVIDGETGCVAVAIRSGRWVNLTYATEKAAIESAACEEVARPSRA